MRFLHCIRRILRSSWMTAALKVAVESGRDGLTWKQYQDVCFCCVSNCVRTHFHLRVCLYVRCTCLTGEAPADHWERSSQQSILWIRLPCHSPHWFLIGFWIRPPCDSHQATQAVSGSAACASWRSSSSSATCALSASSRRPPQSTAGYAYADESISKNARRGIAGICFAWASLPTFSWNNADSWFNCFSLHDRPPRGWRRPLSWKRSRSFRSLQWRRMRWRSLFHGSLALSWASSRRRPTLSSIWRLAVCKTFSSWVVCFSILLVHDKFARFGKGEPWRNTFPLELNPGWRRRRRQRRRRQLGWLERWMSTLLKS